MFNMRRQHGWWIFRGAVSSPQAVHRQVAVGLLSIIFVHVKKTLSKIIVQPRDQEITESKMYLLHPGTKFLQCSRVFSKQGALGKTCGPGLHVRLRTGTITRKVILYPPMILRKPRNVNRCQILAHMTKRFVDCKVDPRVTPQLKTPNKISCFE